jgi:hypothetical protein
MRTPAGLKYKQIHPHFLLLTLLQLHDFPEIPNSKHIQSCRTLNLTTFTLTMRLTTTRRISKKLLLSASRHRFFSTHEVFNQGVPLTNFNLYKSDPTLISFANAFTDSSGQRVLNDHGVSCGTDKSMQTAR